MFGIHRGFLTIEVVVPIVSLRPVHSNHLWAIKVVFIIVGGVHKSKSVAKELLGPNQVVFMERIVSGYG